MQIRAPRDLAVAVLGRRVELGMSQAALATAAGVSRKWVYEFEAGKPSAELGHVLRVFEVLGLRLDVTPDADATR